MALFATSDQTFVIILILYCFFVCCFSGSVCPFSPCYIFYAKMLLSLESSLGPCWNDVAEFVPLTNVSALGHADQQGGTGVHDRGVQTPAPAWLHRGREVIVENHRATAGEHDPSVRVHGAHALSGRGEPRTLPGFAYATCRVWTCLSKEKPSTAGLCSLLCQGNQLNDSCWCHFYRFW